MQHGDISNLPPKRLWVVFEGLLGLWAGPALPPRRMWHWKAKEHVLTPPEFQVNPAALDAIRDAAAIQGWHVEVVTWLGEVFAEQLEAWLPGQMVHAPVLHGTPQELARVLAFRPDVYRVYDPDPQHLLTFGPRAVHLPPEHAQQIGKL